MSDTKKTSQENFDAEFDAFLREENSRMANLYRKLPHPEPDAALDARVRAQARQAAREHAETAAAKTTLGRPTARARRWLPAVGAAATLVLVAGLAWRLAPPSARRETVPTAQTAAPAPTAAQNGSVAVVPAPAGEPAQKAAEPLASADAQAPQSPPRAAAAAPAMDTAKVRAKSSTGSDVAAAPAHAESANRSAPAAFPAAPSPPRAQSAPPAAAPPAPTEEESKRYTSDEAAAVRPPAAQSRSVARPAAAADLTSNAPPVAIEADTALPAHYRWEIAADASMPARRGVYPPDPPPLPAWVEIIRTMRRDGHRDAAQQALADLRSRHPDFGIPADLRDLE